MKKSDSEKPVVFISWSGKYSKSYEIAMLLHEWLPVVIQQVNFWISEDIELGKFAIQKIVSQLFKSSAGIFCITGKSINSNWLNFEAGAISKVNGTKDADDVNNVISLLIDVSENEFYNSGSPLANFQSVSLTKKNMLQVVNTLNNLTEDPLSEEILRKAFEASWDSFEKGYNDIISSHNIEQSRAIEYKHNNIDVIIKDLYHYGINILGETSNRIIPGCLFCIDIINRLNVPIVIYSICVKFNDGSIYNVERKSGLMLTLHNPTRYVYSDTLPLTISPYSFSPLFYILAADDDFLRLHDGESVTLICKTDIYDIEKEIVFSPKKDALDLVDNYITKKHDNL